MRGETDQVCCATLARSCPVSSTSLKVVKYWFALMDGGKRRPAIITANTRAVSVGIWWAGAGTGRKDKIASSEETNAMVIS